MPKQPTPKPSEQGVSINIRLQFNEFKIPPVQDALVLGKTAPIGCDAMRRALTLLHVSPFEHLPLRGDDEDDVVGDILVRRSVINKIAQDQLRALIVRRVKPFMTSDEILQLRIDTEVSLDFQMESWPRGNDPSTAEGDPSR